MDTVEIPIEEVCEPICTILTLASEVKSLAVLAIPTTLPVSPPTNPDAVIIPAEALIPPELIVTPPPTTILVAVAIPSAGVTRVGEVANTFAPLPVSSVNAAANSADVKEPNDVVVLLDVIAPVRFGILVAVVAVPVSDPTKLVAVTIPPLIVTPVPTRSVEKVETPLEFIFPVTFPVRFPTKLGAVRIPVVFTFPVMASTENPFPVKGS